MGLSLNTCHIYNAERLTKAQFKKAFCENMKAKGYTTATEDTAELTYALVFSKDRRWVTVLSEDEADPNSTAAEYAKSLGTYAVVVELVDSDFAELSLFDETGAHIDTLTLGESYLEDAAPMGEPSAWQPLMVGSWEQVEAIQNGSYTFAEEALADFAPVIGMDGENILLDCEADPEDVGASMVYFKNAGARTKSLTLNSAFIKIFGEYLEPLGYRFIKGKKYPVYVRVVSDEIVHIISIRKAQSDYRGNPGFDIVGNPVTTYWKEVLMDSIDGNDRYSIETNWNVYRQLMYRKKDIELDFDFMKKIRAFYYIKNDDAALIEAMRYSLEITKQWLLAEMNKITDMHSFIRYAYIFKLGSTYIPLAFDEQTGKIKSKDHDSFIIIKSKYDDDDMWDVLEECEALSKSLKRGLEQKKAVYRPELMEEEYREYDELMKKEFEKQNQYRIKQIELRDKIFADEKLCQEISENLDRIKGESNEWLEKELAKNAPAVKTAKEKKLTLDTAFVEVFKTGLGDIGFSHIKINRHSLFVRIINDDILQIITYRKVSASKRNCKSYELYGGMATLYRRTIDFEETPENWLRDVCDYYVHIIPEKERDDRLARSMLTFNCDISNNESMIRDITYSYELADRYMLPVLNNITDLNDCIKYFYDFSYDMHEMKLAELDKFMNEGIYCGSEGLLLILMDFKDDCSKWLQREIKRETKFVSDPERADLIRLKCERKYSEQLEIRNRIQNSLDLKKAAIDLAKQYRANNLKMLEGYNL